MNGFTVLYREMDGTGFETPSAFVCLADNSDHAEEQCLNAYPGCDVLSVEDTDDSNEAFERYFFEQSMYDEDEYDGQPDEAQEWSDFDPDC
jgi:hypothetical protein